MWLHEVGHVYGRTRLPRMDRLFNDGIPEGEAMSDELKKLAREDWCPNRHTKWHREKDICPICPVLVSFAEKMLREAAAKIHAMGQEYVSVQMLKDVGLTE